MCLLINWVWGGGGPSYERLILTRDLLNYSTAQQLFSTAVPEQEAFWLLTRSFLLLPTLTYYIKNGGNTSNLGSCLERIGSLKQYIFVKKNFCKWTYTIYILLLLDSLALYMFMQTAMVIHSHCFVASYQWIYHDLVLVVLINAKILDAAKTFLSPLFQDNSPRQWEDCRVWQPSRTAEKFGPLLFDGQRSWHWKCEQHIVLTVGPMGWKRTIRSFLIFLWEILHRSL